MEEEIGNKSESRGRRQRKEEECQKMEEVGVVNERKDWMKELGGRSENFGKRK